MVGPGLRRWTAPTALAVAALSLALIGAPLGARGTTRKPASDTEITRPWALLEQTVAAVRPEAPTVTWMERVSPRPLSQAAAAVFAGLAACLALAWSPGSRILPGRPPLRRRRYSAARRAPPLPAR